MAPGNSRDLGTLEQDFHSPSHQQPNKPYLELDFSEAKVDNNRMK